VVYCEQVYLPSVLQAKKRYVGFKYEHPDEVEPKFDAKGIETVRRDGVPAQQKMLESALKFVMPSPTPFTTSHSHQAVISDSGSK
jgi:DNA polymerase zeta